jgi:hypothetical protein
MAVEIVLRVLVFLLGLAVALEVVLSAMRTFVLPRSAADPLSRTVFLGMRVLFNPWTRRARSYEERDRAMALLAPVSLLLLPIVWLVLVLAGYMAMFWALGVRPLRAAFTVSGASLLTLGFAAVDNLPRTALAFSEAALGLILVALLIAYLPTMYTAFSRRENAVTMLEVRAGSPPSAPEMLLRYHRLKRLDKLGDLWVTWEVWFADVEETHTSLAALAFFRSPQPDHSWVTAAGAVLDAASLVSATLDIAQDPQVDLCIRAGYLSLRRIADFFRVPYNPAPSADDPISVTRFEFDEVYDRLAAAGLPLKPDRDQAWRDFCGWRVNYDTVLLALAALTMAPEAPWSSDRSLSGLRRSKITGLPLRTPDS